MDYFLGLGSNLGDRFSNLSNALKTLVSMGVILKQSKVYQTKPIDMDKSAFDFLNMVILFKTDSRPGFMLQNIKQIEFKMGRNITNSHNQPRIIDIDILFADHQIIKKPELIIPHPHIHKRGFAMIPLCEIAPDFVHPVFSQTNHRILEQLKKENFTLDQSVFEYEKQF